MNWNSQGWKDAAHDYQREQSLNGSAKAEGRQERPPRQANEKWQLGTVRLSDVEPQQTDWLWPGRLAAGKLTLFAGDPGLGKSQITIDIAARITTGADWPDDGRAPLGNVIILSAEDGVADTLRPRFEAAGGNLARVEVVTTLTGDAGNRRGFTLQSVLALLSEKVRAFGDVNLVIVDPVTSYCGKVDGNSTTDIRAVLAPLSEFAEEHRLSVIAVSHPPKSAAGGKALYAVTGSLAWIAAARTAFTIVEDAEDKTRRLFLNSKNNLAPLAPGIGYRLVQRIVTGDCVASHVDWDNLPVTMSADQALAATAGGDGGGKPLARAGAETFLQKVLADGPAASKKIQDEAKEAGLSWATVRRAKDNLGVVADRESHGADGQGRWLWTMPNPARCSSPPQDAHLSEVSALHSDERLAPLNGVPRGHVEDPIAAPGHNPPAKNPTPVLDPLTAAYEKGVMPAFLDRRCNGLGSPAISAGPDDDLADFK